jgi:sugar lactone lactonase YvrE
MRPVRHTAQLCASIVLLLLSIAIPSHALMGGAAPGRDLNLTAGNALVTTLAGAAGNSGSADGTGAAARFSSLRGVTTDGTHLYVADTENHTIRKIAIATREVTTLAGAVGSAGSADGIGPAARFYLPGGITTDGTHLYVADTENHTIRKIVIATGEVTTLAGKADLNGTADGIGSAARFYYPGGITTDGTHLYVADTCNFTIRKIVIATGEVTTLAGAADSSGWADGTGAAARFDNPTGITTDGTNLYVADQLNHTIRRIAIATREVTTLAGTAGTAGWADGIGTATLFSYPQGITTDGTNLYVGDSDSHTIRKIVIATREVTTLAGAAETSGSTDGMGAAARFHNPYAITTDGTHLYVADQFNWTIRKISALPMGGAIQSGDLNLTRDNVLVTTLAGLAGSLGSTDGTGSGARFDTPYGVTTDGESLYTADNVDNTIRKIAIATGAVTTLAGAAGSSGSVDGTGSAARFNNPTGITTDGTNLYVAERTNQTIRKIVIATGAVTTLAGTAGSEGSADGNGSAARFKNPYGLTTDGENLYVADSYNYTIRKIVIATGEVTTLAGTADSEGSADGTGSTARFNAPYGLTTDGENLYVADTLNHTIRKIEIATGAVTTLAGSAGSNGSADGTGTAARFKKPHSLTTDGANLYVVDSFNSTIRKIAIATGVVTTLAGSAGSNGSDDGSGSAARFFYPYGLTTDGKNLYVADSLNSTIRKIGPDTAAPTVTAVTAPAATNSLSIAVTIAAGDNAGGSGVAAYLVTDSSTPPAASAPGWSATNPSTYTATADGAYTLYGWAKDGAGNVSAPYAPVTVVVDRTTPTTAGATPSADAVDFAVTGAIAVTFGEAMDPSTLSSSTFTVAAGGIAVLGTVSYDAATRTATFTPASPLAYGTHYSVTLTTGVKDEAGNPLGSALTWGFTTQSSRLMGGAIQGNDLNLTGDNATVTTPAGTAGVSGSIDGTGPAARFNNPLGVTTDGTNLYVADTNNHAIRKIVIATGAVTTLAGSAGNTGSADGTGSAARFNAPGGVTTDGEYLYVADTNNHTIRRIVIATGAVTTLAGSANVTGSTDGTGDAAGFNTPYGITTDGTNLYVADTINSTIRRVGIATGAVTTLAGSASVIGSADGTGAAARFNAPAGLTTDGRNLYVVDSGNSAIRTVVITTGAVTTLASRPPTPFGITTDGTYLYVSEYLNHDIRKMSIATGLFTAPLAGSPGNTGSSDGTGAAARFNTPGAVTTDGTHLYVVDSGNHTVRKISSVVADTTAPTVTSVAAPAAINSLSIAVTIAASDDAGGSGVAAYLVTDSSTPPAAAASGWSATNPFTYTVTADGTYTLYGWAKDGEGNVSAPCAPVTVVVDRAAPTTAGAIPSANADAFAVTGAIAVTFSEAMDPATINGSTFTVTMAGGTAVLGTVSYDAATRTATFTPATPLAFNATYGVTLTTAVKDAAGNPLGSAITWGFTTQSAALSLMGGAVQGADPNLTPGNATVTTLAGTAQNFGSADGTGPAARFYEPYGITTDGTNLYVADTSNDAIRRIVIATGEVTTLAGTAGSYGSADGTGPAAQFHEPHGITTDGTNLYVADTENHTIRKIVIATGEVTTLAGAAGSEGWDDGAGSAARFALPCGITTDGTNLYVVAISTPAVRKIVIATGEVTTLAGGAFRWGSDDGTGQAAAFDVPWGITTDGTNLYVTDLNNHTIRKIVIATGVVTTLAGAAGSEGSADGTGSAARFNHPRGLTTDGTNLYVADTDNNTLRKIVIATGVVTTLAGSTFGWTDGTGSTAKFLYPGDITTDGTNLYVADTSNATIRAIAAGRTAPTVSNVTAPGATNSLSIAVTIAANGHVDGPGVAAYLVTDSSTPPSASASGWSATNPFVYTVTADGTYTLYGWALDGAGNVSAPYAPVTVIVDRTTPAIAGPGAIPSADATAFAVTRAISVTFNEAMDASTFNSSTFTVVAAGAIAVAGTASYDAATRTATFTPASPLSYGTAYTATLTTGVKDAAGNPLGAALTWGFTTQSQPLMGGAVQGGALNLTPDNAAVTTLAGAAGSSGSADGTGPAARFNEPYGITTDGTNLYVADTSNHTIRRIVIATGEVTTLAGVAGTEGWADGTGPAARFNSPYGITTDGKNLYVADTFNMNIRKIVIDTGVVTVLAGEFLGFGWADGTGAAARFTEPRGITTDGTNLYVTDTFSHTIRKIVIATGEVTTLAGAALSSGSADGTGAAARFDEPYAITTDGTNLYVADTYNDAIRRIVIATGEVTTLAGTAGSFGSVDGVGPGARFNLPSGITTDGTNLYVADYSNFTIRRIVIATGEVTTLAGTAGSSASVDGVGPGARFNRLSGITKDGTNLYVADNGNQTIRRISAVVPDTTAPTVTSVTAPAAVNNLSIAVTIAANDNTGGSGVAAYLVTASSTPPSAAAAGWSATTPFTHTATADGTYMLYGWAKDGAGNVSAPYAPVTVVVDRSVPTTAGDIPSADATAFAVNGAITVTFNEAMDASTFNSSTFTVATAGGIAVLGTVSYDAATRTATFTPASPLSYGTHYTVTVTTGVKDEAGNPLGSALTWGFTTQTQSDTTTLMGGAVQGRDLNLTPGNAAVTTLAGSAQGFGPADGTGPDARFNIPDGITTDGTSLYVADTFNHAIRRVVIATGVVTTLAGAGSSGSADGTGPAAEFNAPYGITTDGMNLYVADTSNQTIRRIVIETGVVTTLAGAAGVSGSADGTGAAASFNYPQGITTDGTHLYVADTSNHTLRRIVIETGAVTTLAGTAGASGSADGTGATATFNFPQGITTDGTNLYVADDYNHTIRKIVIATGAVTTLAGAAGSAGSADGTGATAAFNFPQGITTDGTNLYVADTANSTIRKVSIATGAVTTLAGAADFPGSADGTGGAASFSYPYGMTTDGTNLYVADTANNTIRKIGGSAGSDTTAPTVTAVTAPPAVSSLSIAVTITAGDNPGGSGVAAYLVTDSSTPPSASAAGWSATTPFTYTVTADGTYTLHGWAKDGAGNVSAPYAPVTVVVDRSTPTTAGPGAIPSADATGFAVTGAITVTFSEAMDASTLNSSTFTVATAGGTAVAGTVSYDAATRTATFTPASPLSYGTHYSVTVTTGVKDEAGNPLGSALTWGFTTQSAALPLMGGSVQGNDLNLTLSNAAVTTLAGLAGSSGPADGTGWAAGFDVPFGITTDGQNIYVADTGNETIRRIVIATGEVTTLAGAAGSYGAIDGTGTAARFSAPYGITTDGTHLYVADTFNHTIRRIVIATGVVTTLAGTAGSADSTDGTGPAARFDLPFGITTDGTHLYVADTFNHTIRRIVIATGVVTTLAGAAGNTGSADGAGATARFLLPHGITTDGTHLYVADTGNDAIRRIVIATGVVTTLAGAAGNTGSGDGTGAAAAFNFPQGITTDGTNLYIAEANNHTLRKIVIATGEVTTLAGAAGSFGSADGMGATARFDHPAGMTTDGTNLYVADQYNHTLRRIGPAVPDTEAPTVTSVTAPATTNSLSIAVTITAGDNPGGSGVAAYLATDSSTPPSASAAGWAATNPFTYTATADGTYTLHGWAKDGAGNVSAPHAPVTVVVDRSTPTTAGPGAIPSADATAFAVDGAITVTFSEAMDASTINSSTFTVATAGGSAVLGTVGYDAATRTATFTPASPLSYGTHYSATVTTGVRDEAGNPLGSALTWNFTTQNNTATLMGGAVQGNDLNLTPGNASVTTLAGAAGSSATVDGTGAAARFTGPWSLTTDGANLYVAEPGYHVIRKVVIATGVVTTLAGTAGYPGSDDGTGTATKFLKPYDLTTDGTNLYVADTDNNTIRKIVIATGAVTTLAGTAGYPGSDDGTGAAAQFNGPWGITTDGTHLYVTDNGSSTIRKIVIATGAVTTLAGAAGSTGSADGTGSGARFRYPAGISTDGTNLYVADTDNHIVRKIVIATGEVTTLAGAAGSTGSADGTGAARFHTPYGITTDGTNLYVADTMNHTIRKIVIATGAVTTLAGAAGSTGSADGTGAARFYSPTGITTDGTSLYVGDASNFTIRQIGASAGSDTTTPTVTAVTAPPAVNSLSIAVTITAGDNPGGSGVAAYLATDSSTPPSATASGWSAANPFTYTATGDGSYSLYGWAKDGAGNVSAPHAPVTVVVDRSAPATAGPGAIPSADATGFAVDGAITVTFSEAMDASTINNSTFTVVTAGGSAVSGTVSYDATTRTATFTPASPLSYGTRYSVTVTTGVRDEAGNALGSALTWDFTTQNAALPLMGGAVQGKDLNLTQDNAAVTTLAGEPGSYGATDGIGPAARFYHPYGITTDGTHLYVAEYSNNTIRRIVIATGEVTTLAGEAGSLGAADGTGAAARFHAPYGVTTDGTNLYVADTYNHTIRRIVIATGEVTTLAGEAGSSGSADGVGSAARFATPFGITTDGTNLYVADTVNRTVRRIVIATGEVTTLAGEAGSYGSADGTGTAARFYNLRGITTDGTHLYVTDHSNHTLRRIVIATGEVTTLAGTAGSLGTADGTGSAARFYFPIGITTDGTNLYVADTSNQTLRKIVIATGEVTTLAGAAGSSGSVDGTGSAARFFSPSGITTDGVNLYVTDSTNETIRKIGASAGSDTTAPTVTGAASDTPSGSYGAGSQIAITLFFSEAVTSSGLTLTFNSGGSVTTGPLGGVTTWSGVYTVGADQTSPDLTLSSITGTIADGAANSTVNPVIPAGQNIADAGNIVIPMNGACGSANGGIFTTAPADNLCNPGTAGSVSGSGTGAWIWSCTGFNGGTTALCSADTPGVPGDVDGNGLVTLTDAIVALQVMSGITPAQPVNPSADVNGDGRIGLAETFYILQKAAGLR